MPKFVLIDRLGTTKTVNAKEISDESLYRKVGFKSTQGFVVRHAWGPDDGIDQIIQLYAKMSGKAGQENKYDFPPPMDSTLFFGSCALVGRDSKTNEIVDLDVTDWEEIYEFLFGGFEDIGSDDSEDEEEELDTDDEVAELGKSTGVIVAQTKQGYAKDGFIVDDDDAEEDYEEEEEDELDESDEDSIPVKKRAAAKPRTKKETAVKKGSSTAKKESSTVKKESSTAKKEPTTKKASTKPVASFEPVVSAMTIEDLEDCESELSEEAYVEYSRIDD
jgi:hypothetical protein